MIRRLAVALTAIGALASTTGVAEGVGSPLAELVSRVSAATRAGIAEPAVLGEVEAALRQYLRAAGASGHRPHPGLDVTTILLHTAADGSFSIAALVIRPGGATPVHDHGTWTVWGTLEGRDREIRYARGEDGYLPAFVAARELAAGSTSRVPGPPDDLHRVENAGTAPSVSIHVHGADMSRQVRRAYDLERSRIIEFVQSYVEPGAIP